MVRSEKRISKTAGNIPGELIHVGDIKIDKVNISVLDYDEKVFEERGLTDIKETFPLKDSPTVSWININGLHDVDIIVQHYMDENEDREIEKVLVGTQTGFRHELEESLGKILDGEILIINENELADHDKDMENEEEKVTLSAYGAAMGAAQGLC